MEDRKEILELVQRWMNLPGFNLRGSLLSQPEGPFGRTANGLVDYRGVRLEGAIYKLEAADLDFGFSEMGSTGQLGGALRVLRCRFDECKYQSTIDAVFEACSFVGSNLSDSTIREAFISCDFSSANLSRARGSEIRFSGCRFIGTSFVKACFYDSEFVDCLFENTRFGRGSLARSSFKGCKLLGVDWRDTILDGVRGLV
jgi:uncharacterized protein YjbI with pentapeptide repeats